MKDTLNTFIPSSAQTLKSVLIVLVSVIVFYSNDFYQIKVIYMFGLGLYFAFSEDRISFVVLCNFVFDRALSLFEEGTLDQAFIGAPIITLGAGVSIGFRDVLLLALLIRIVIKANVKIGGGSIWISMLVFYGLIISFAWGNLSVSHTAFLFRTFGIMAIYYYISNGLKIEDAYKLLHIISLLSFIVVFDQVFTYFSGVRLANTLFSTGRVFRITETVTRIVPYGMVTLFFSMLYGFMLLSISRRKDQRFASATYGSVLIVVSMIGILLSAQRGIGAVFLFTFLFSLRGVVTKYRNLVQLLVIFVLLIAIANSLGLGFDFIMSNMGTRVQGTVNPLVKGELQEVDTSGRQYEIPLLISNFKESPLVGFGLSPIAERKVNNNFGFPNTLIKFGIIGFIVVLMLIFGWLNKIAHVKRYMEYGSPEYVALTMVQSAILGLLIGYSTTLDFFTSSLDFDYYRLAVLLSITSLSIQAFYSKKIIRFP